MRRTAAWLGAFLLAGCVGDLGDYDQEDPSTPGPEDPIPESDYPRDPLEGMPSGAEQLQSLCARGYGDDVSLAFCGSSAPPAITSLRELQLLLGLDATDAQTTSFALTSHSSSLVMRLTSQINPRAILFTRPYGLETHTANPRYTAMGFVRGEQFVELVSKDPSANGELRFFLFSFKQACNQQPGGCAPGDLLTPAVERAYTEGTLYGDEDLANTVFDCLQCHQPDGPGTPRLLRMQELKFGWTHWLTDEARPSVGNVGLCDDFRAAHAGEEYAGIPYELLVNPSPELSGGLGCRGPTGFFAGPNALQAFVENNGFSQQPNEFQSNAIFMEVQASNAMQPTVNDPPGRSTTWDALYQSYLAGDSIPPPYHDHRVTDEDRLQQMTAAYQAVMSGSLPRSSLPAMNVLLDAALPDMTIRARPGATGLEILRQMCQQCHNSRLDQSLSRARFNVQDLAGMAPAEKELAIERIRLPRDHARRMPPARFRDLSEEEIRLVEEELSR